MTVTTPSRTIALLALLVSSGILLTGTGCVTNHPLAGTVTDIQGRQHALFEQEGRRGTVLIFIERECPISNSYAPEINRIVSQYAEFAFFLVQVDPDLTDADARKHAADYALKAPVIIDRKHALVHLAQAAVTPEAAVFSSAGQLLYCGQIDNRMAGFGKMRVEPTQRDLREALDAIQLNRPVPVARTKAIGCYIQDFAHSKAH